MPISLLGGPLDGTISMGLSHLPLYMVATNHGERPIYKRASCSNCTCRRDSVPYVFVGYETCKTSVTVVDHFSDKPHPRPS